MSCYLFQPFHPALVWTFKCASAVVLVSAWNCTHSKRNRRCINSELNAVSLKMIEQPLSVLSIIRPPTIVRPKQNNFAATLQGLRGLSLVAMAGVRMNNGQRKKWSVVEIQLAEKYFSSQKKFVCRLVGLWSNFI